LRLCPDGVISQKSKTLTFTSLTDALLHRCHLVNQTVSNDSFTM
jgi:hypothetical protein